MSPCSSSSRFGLISASTKRRTASRIIRCCSLHSIIVSTPVRAPGRARRAQHDLGDLGGREQPHRRAPEAGAAAHVELRAPFAVAPRDGRDHEPHEQPERPDLAAVRVPRELEVDAAARRRAGRSTGSCASRTAGRAGIAARERAVEVLAARRAEHVAAVVVDADEVEGRAARRRSRRARCAARACRARRPRPPRRRRPSSGRGCRSRSRRRGGRAGRRTAPPRPRSSATLAVDEVAGHRDEIRARARSRARRARPRSRGRAAGRCGCR